MARRRRRRVGRRKTPNTWFIIFQIVVLLAFLIAIIEVRDSVADGTSVVVESLTGEDVQVQQRDTAEQSDFPGERTEDQPREHPDSNADQQGDDDPGDTPGEPAEN